MIKFVFHTTFLLINQILTTLQNTTSDLTNCSERDIAIRDQSTDLDINESTIAKYDIGVNTEFLQNSTNDQQLFSFACFLQNVLLQALSGEEKYKYTNNNIFIPDLIPSKIQKYSYNIDIEFTDQIDYFEMESNQSESNNLIVQSHCFIILPHNQMSRIIQYKENKNLKPFVTFLTHHNENQEKNDIIKIVDDKVQSITNNFMSFDLDKKYLNKFQRVYISILYFKGTWIHDFEKSKSLKEFSTIKNNTIMRKYIQIYDASIQYDKYTVSGDKMAEAFILPFYNNETGRFKAIYLSPLFVPNGNADFIEIYKQFINQFAIENNDQFLINESKFKSTRAHVFIPEFDQTSEKLDLIQLLPLTYQRGPAYHTETIMKSRVKIDEKGIEGAAICCSVCTDGISRHKIISINVDKPYIVLIFDEKLQQSLFIIKDTGLNTEN